MRKVKSVIGQEVLSLADGHRIAVVKDIVVDRDNEHVAALLVQEGGVLSSARIVPTTAVHSYGRDAIVIEGDDAVVDAGEMPELDASTSRTLGGMKVFSDTGEQVGTVADVYFEEDDGRIVGFEISSGRVDDFASGRRFLAAEQLDRVGDEIMYIRADTAQHLEPVPDGTGGAQGVLEDVASKVGDAAQQVGAKLADASAAAGQDGDGTSSESDRPPGTDLVGRRSGSDVTDTDGRIIVANGQSIAIEHVERANASGQGDALRAAADAWSEAERERMISGTIEQVTDAAGSAWDRFMGKIAALTDESGKRVSEQQTKARLAAINDAVGRPVTKVILDRSDEVVLNLGDIITHEAVQRAYDAGILDTLLDSAYKGDVAFERDEMKAPTEGTSTVEKASGGAAVVDELQGSVESAEAERSAAAEQKRREADEARDLRELERQERADARADAAERAASGEQHEDPTGNDDPEPGRADPLSPPSGTP